MDGEMGVRGGVHPHAHPFRLYPFMSLNSYDCKLKSEPDDPHPTHFCQGWIFLNG
jgi:hypothetical protein